MVASFYYPIKVGRIFIRPTGLLGLIENQCLKVCGDG